MSSRTAPAPLFQDDFGQWWLQQVKEPYTGDSFQRIGGKTFRFEVQQGEHASFDGSTVDRAEVLEHNGTNGPLPLPLNTSIWFSGSLTIPTDAISTTDWCVLMQFHATPDAGDIEASPVLSLYLNSSEQFVIDSRASSAQPLVVNPAATIHYTGSVVHYQRTNFVGNVQFDHAGNGFLKIWKDSAQIVNYVGAIGYNDASGPYLKTGIYRSTSPTPYVIEWKNLECGTADLSSRINNPLP